MKKGKKLFHGWWMVLVITVMFLTGNAAPLAIVLKQLMNQFQTGRGEVSLCQSISMIAMGITGIFVGKMLHRYQPRTFLLWGSIVGGVSSLLLAFTSSIWIFYVISLFAGIAGGFSNAISMFTLLSKWFVRKWGQALGVAMAGGGIGSIVIQPLVGIIAQNYGWRAPYLFAGLIVLVLNVPLVLFVLKDNPESMGLLPDGDEPDKIAGPTKSKPAVQTAAAPPPAGTTGLASFLKSPALWFVGICFALISIGSSAVTTHEVSFITDMNVSATTAAWVRGITLGIGSISAIASGWLADRFISRYVSILFFLIAMVGMIVLVQADTMSKVWLFAVIYGVGIGASGTLLPIVTRDIFGADNFSVLFGFVVVLFSLGNAVGTPLAGFMFDATGSYQSVFSIITVLYAAAVIWIYFAFGANPKPLMRRSLQKK
jgi:sugar phosphate permease